MAYRKLVAALGLALGLALAASPGSWAATCDGVTLPDHVEVGTTSLTLNGLGIRKATMLRVHVYVAGLYLPEKSGDASAILAADQPWHLLLHFVRDVTADEIRDAFTDGFERAPATAQPYVTQLNAAMADYATGHTLAFSHAPGSGVGVDVNGAGGPTIGDAAFAQNLLGIWLGPNPPNAELKSGLLGGACD